MATSDDAMRATHDAIRSMGGDGWWGQIRSMGQKPRLYLIGDSIMLDGNHFVIRYDENNEPNYWEINGEIVSKEEFLAVYRGRAPWQ